MSHASLVRLFTFLFLGIGTANSIVAQDAPASALNSKAWQTVREAFTVPPAWQGKLGEYRSP